MSDHSRALVPLETWAYSSPDLHAAGRAVDIGLLAEALIYYESLLINVSNQRQFAELISWFEVRGMLDTLLSMVKDGTLGFYDWSFATAPVLKDGSYSLWNIQDDVQAQPETFRRRFLYHRDIEKALPNVRQRVRLYKAFEGRVVEAKSSEFSDAIENAKTDYLDARRNALIVQAFVDEVYRFKNLGRPPQVEATVQPKTDASGHEISWNVDLDRLAKLAGPSVAFGVSTPLSAGAHCNRQLLSASMEGCDLFLGRPMGRLAGDKLYETARTPGRSGEIIESLKTEVDFPDVRRLVNAGSLAFDQVLAIRAKATRFRAWLQSAADRDYNAIIAYHNEVAKESGLTYFGRKSLGFFGVLLGGAVGGYIGGLAAGPVGGMAGGVAGSGATFLCDLAARLRAGWKPVVFGDWVRNRVATHSEDAA